MRKLTKLSLIPEQKRTNTLNKSRAISENWFVVIVGVGLFRFGKRCEVGRFSKYNSAKYTRIIYWWRSMTVVGDDEALLAAKKCFLCQLLFGMHYYVGPLYLGFRIRLNLHLTYTYMKSKIKYYNARLVILNVDIIIICLINCLYIFANGSNWSSITKNWSWKSIAFS